MTKWAKETENIIKQVISILDPQDLPYKTYRDYIKEVLDIPKDKAKQIYDSIPQTEEGNEGFYGSSSRNQKQKRGRFEVVSTLGYHYTFVALYTIESDRSAAHDELLIERYIPDENFCATIYGVYYKKYKAPPIDDDFETLAKRIISRLDEYESEKKWILGGSIEDDTVACYRIILKEAYNSPYYRFADKGSLVFVSSDGLEYVFTAEDTSGPDYMMEYSLKVECEAIGLCKELYSESYCAR